jgi:signal transduction histidine kinase
MRYYSKTEKLRHVLAILQKYMLFFLLMGFTVTCCMLLFLKQMSARMGIDLTQDGIQGAARLTFANILLLTLLCTVIDGIRRYYTVDRPVKKITDAAEQIMQGNLDIRIEKLKTIDLENGLNVIIDDINRMAKELSGMETLRTDFIANVSHELKTPLAVMQNYGTLLQQPDLPEEQRMEYARAITEASQSLANMVSNILKLNKLENQTIYPATVTYDLGEQLCECLVGLEEVWDKKGLDIEADVAEDVYVTADPELLTLVWNNLFSNAIKFTEAGGKISLTLKSEGGKAVVQVADTGCGISPEVGKHIFEKFYQGDTSHAAKGNGLGLALVKRVMDITGGDISVSSEVGRGSVFTVTLARANKGVNALARLESGGDYKQHEQEGEDG